MAPTARAHDHLPEYAVKAAFLFHFVEFVEWPAHAPHSDATVTIGVVGRDPFGDVLDRAVLNKTAAGRPLAVRRFATVEEVEPCHVLFISTSEVSRLPAILTRLGDHPVLTVGEADRFARRGGMIGFFFEEDKVRLEVNAAVAAAAGLRISSKLLSVARVVARPADGGR